MRDHPAILRRSYDGWHRRVGDRLSSRNPLSNGAWRSSNRCRSAAQQHLVLKTAGAKVKGLRGTPIERVVGGAHEELGPEAATSPTRCCMQKD